MALSKGKFSGVAVTKKQAEFTLISTVKRASHQVEDYVDGDLLKSIQYYAVTKRTKEMAILCSLLATTATISAERAMVSTNTHGKRQCAALNLLLVAKKGSGKSQSISEFCMDVLDNISDSIEDGKKPIFYDNPGTFAGLFSFDNEAL